MRRSVDDAQCRRPSLPLRRVGGSCGLRMGWRHPRYPIATATYRGGSCQRRYWLQNDGTAILASWRIAQLRLISSTIMSQGFVTLQGG
jgi:hypothetical protein